MIEIKVNDIQLNLTLNIFISMINILEKLWLDIYIEFNRK